jgi:DNA-binding NarL/FixJ family response regulator
VVTRVLVADDHGLIRAGVRMLLAAESDIEVVGEAATGDEAVALARELHADLVIMDLRMPGLDGVEATRQLIEEGGGDPDELTRVLVLSTYKDDASVYDSLRAGASGFVVKDVAPQDLVPAVRSIAKGDSWIDPSVAGTVLAALRIAPAQRPVQSELVARLTAREREVLQLMAAGLSNAEIRDRLVLSEATVRTHVSRILMKTGSRDRSSAVVLAFQSRLVRAPD